MKKAILCFLASIFLVAPVFSEDQQKPPELSSISMLSAPPGTEVTITGKNFAKNPKDNKVLFGEVAANVLSGSAESLTVVIPEMDYPQLGVSITVQVGKIKSKSELHIDVQNKEY